MNVSILLYEQNETQQSFMSQWLESSGMDCTVAGTANHAITMLNNQSFDAIVITHISDRSETDIISHLRYRLQKSTPVLTVHDSLTRTDIVPALISGSNDFIIKPLKHEPLANAVRRLIENHNKPTSLANCYPYQFDAKNSDVWLYGEKIQLSSDEYQLAAYLFFFRERIVLLDELQRENRDSKKSVENIISILKRKLKLSDSNSTTDRPWQLKSIRDAGYRLTYNKNQSTQLAFELFPKSTPPRSIKSNPVVQVL